MIDATTVAFLEGGPGIVVGAVSPDGTPCVARGWGITVIDPERGRVRLLLPTDDPTLLDLVGDGRRVAATAASVRTYQALQLKGRSLGVAADVDVEVVAQYQDAFFADLWEINGMSRELCDRFAPVGVVACTVEVDELYDQTPGPTAGAVLAPVT